MVYTPSILSAVLPVFFASLCFLLALSMALPLLHQEDERRTFILTRTASTTFYFAVITLLLDGLLSLFGWNWDPSPLFALCAVCLFYCGVLAHYNRKFGE